MPTRARVTLVCPFICHLLAFGDLPIDVVQSLRSKSSHLTRFRPLVDGNAVRVIDQRCRTADQSLIRLLFRAASFLAVLS